MCIRDSFIAVQLLQSFVEVGVLTAEEAATFMASVDTVGSRIGQDFAQLPKADFLARYGHLRPGTYDILSPRYDEAPDLYFDWSSVRPAAPAPARFEMCIRDRAAITAAPWGSDRVVVRSSARGEDGAAGSSQAGRYDSVLGVAGSAAVAQAIDRVIASFANRERAESDDDQIFVQPMLCLLYTSW